MYHLTTGDHTLALTSIHQPILRAAPYKKDNQDMKIVGYTGKLQVDHLGPRYSEAENEGADTSDSCLSGQGLTLTTFRLKYNQLWFSNVTF